MTRPRPRPPTAAWTVPRSTRSRRGKVHGPMVISPPSLRSPGTPDRRVQSLGRAPNWQRCLAAPRGQGGVPCVPVRSTEVRCRCGTVTHVRAQDAGPQLLACECRDDRPVCAHPSARRARCHSTVTCRDRGRRRYARARRANRPGGRRTYARPDRAGRAASPARRVRPDARVRAARAGLDAGGVRRGVGVSLRWITDLEAGKARPSDGVCRKLAHALLPDGGPLKRAVLDRRLQRLGGGSLRPWTRTRPPRVETVRLYERAAEVLDAEAAEKVAKQVDMDEVTAALLAPPPEVPPRSAADAWPERWPRMRPGGGSQDAR